jgi:hypothetical protein
MEIGLEIDVDNIELLNEEKEKEIHIKCRKSQFIEVKKFF